MATIQNLAEKWLRLDRNQVTRNEISTLLSQGNEQRLEELLRTRLAFGTAGLRAAMGAGFSKMNELTVIQATHGVARWLIQHHSPAASAVVIGHDHRHHSDAFARAAAGVFLTLGFRVYLMKPLVHTPLVPFAVRHLNCVAGIMITASHNPKDDNGYKLYGANGCQIIPPADEQIASLIEEYAENVIWSPELCDHSELCTDPIDALKTAYFDALVSSLFEKQTVSDIKIKFCYTPLHGVGLEYAQEAFKRFQLPPFVVVPQQASPDPDFPTVRFPNPEEGRETLRLALQTADDHQCQIVLANDPDADRLAIAERQSNNSWKLFTGNEMGIILAHLIVQRTIETKGKDYLKKCALLASTVSSQFLHLISKQHGITYTDTLTGFKWLGNTALQLKAHGKDILFAFEEAIGFMLGSAVYDKDGISALAFLAQNIVRIYSQGETLSQLLESIYQEYRSFPISNNSYLICHDRNKIECLFKSLRFFSHNRSYNYPVSIGGIKVVAVRDLTVGYDSTKSDHKPTMPLSREMITFTLENSARITLRTSGTEPKIKWYAEMFVASQEEQVKKPNALDLIIISFVEEILRPEAQGLTRRP